MNYGIGVGVYFALPLLFGVLTFICCICFFLCKCLCMCCKCCDPKPEGAPGAVMFPRLAHLVGYKVTPNRSAWCRSTC